MYVIENVLVAPGQTLTIGDEVIISVVGTGAFTVTSASPAVFSQTGHGLVAGNVVQFSVVGSGVLAAGLLANTNYYVISTGLTANAFEVSLTAGGTAVNTTSAGTATQILSTPPQVKGAAGTTGILLGTVVNISNGASGGNVYLQEQTVTAPANNALVTGITVDVLASNAPTTYVADLSGVAGTTANSTGFGYFNLSSTNNGQLDETSFAIATEKQFLSYGVNPGNTSQVIGTFTKIASA